MRKFAILALSVAAMSMPAAPTKSGEGRQWAHDWFECVHVADPNVALPACERITANGNDSIVAYNRMVDLYYGRCDFVLSLETVNKLRRMDALLDPVQWEELRRMNEGFSYYAIHDRTEAVACADVLRAAPKLTRK